MPAQVNNVSVGMVTSTSITVSWEPPAASTYSVVTFYSVSYTAIDCSGASVSNSTMVTMTTTILDDLIEGVVYDINVTAGNMLGESIPVEISQETDASRKYN